MAIALTIKNKAIIRRMLERTRYLNLEIEKEFPKVYSDKNQIWHLFLLFQANERNLICRFQDQVYEGLILQISYQNAILNLKHFQGTNARSFEIEFIYNNTIYQLEVIITEFYREFVCIKMPEFLSSKKHRKNPRVKVDDIYIHLTLAPPPYPKSGIPNINQNDFRLYGSLKNLLKILESDEPNLSFVQIEIMENFKKWGFENEIHIYDDSNQNDIIYKTLLEEKKTLYIKNCNQIESYTENKLKEEYTNFHNSGDSQISNEKETTPKTNTLIENLQKNDVVGGVSSYAIAPIFFFKKLIGYMRIASKMENTSSINEEIVNELTIFANSLSFGINKSYLAKKYAQQSYLKMIDLSIEGCSILIANQDLYEFIKEFSYVKIKTDIDHVSLFLEAKVIHGKKDEEKNYFILGMQFTKKDLNANKVIEKYIHNCIKIEINTGKFLLN